MLPHALSTYRSFQDIGVLLGHVTSARLYTLSQTGFAFTSPKTVNQYGSPVAISHLHMAVLIVYLELEFLNLSSLAISQGSVATAPWMHGL